MDTGEIQQLVEEGFAALRKGENAFARERFSLLVSAGKADATTWLGMAHANSRLGEKDAVLLAADQALNVEPDNLRALLFKAELLAGQGEPRRALPLYQRALQVAASAGELPKDVVVGLRRAEQACAAQEREQQSFVYNKLRDSGYTPGPTNLRFQQSLELIFGAKRVYYQEPRRYYFPGLPQIQFYEREQFPWLADIEATTPLIREELLGVTNEAQRYLPYLRSSSDESGSYGGDLIDSTNWGALYLWEQGKFVPENGALFPRTLKALEAAPLPIVTDQAPMLLFSRLNPGTTIPPHHGMLNTRLICHLPIIVPDNCGALRVGNEQRSWVQGETLIFDDSIEHEAWNSSAEERVVLLFEIWRPELNEEERRLVSDLLAAVQSYSGSDA